MAATLDPTDLKRRLDTGERVTLLDTRNRDEIDEWRIEHPNADFLAVPYAKLLSANVTGEVRELLPADLTEPVVTVCGRGEASAEVADWLAEEGVDAVNLSEGMEGWARVYERRQLDAATDGAIVYQYQRPSSGCLAYLVVSGTEAMAIDPLRAFAERYAEDARKVGADLTYVVDTHIHADHVSGLRDVADISAATAVLSESAVARGVTYDVETVTDGDRLQVGDVAVKVLATPGHTSGMVSLRLGSVLLCGDTLFVDGLPRPDLESNDEGRTREAARDLYLTLTDRLATLSDDTVVAPGHYSSAAPRADGTYTATLGVVRERLDVFRESEATFVDRVLRSMPPQPANFERIVAVNLGRETAAEDEAFELELGPNNCAAAAD